MGINLLDTAEQYPIPSSAKNPEGATEALIGKWLSKHPQRRKDIVIATKITGGRNVNKENIVKDCDGRFWFLSHFLKTKCDINGTSSRQSSKVKD